MSRILFGVLLAAVGLLYLWLAYESIAGEVQNNTGDWVPYLGGVLFLAAAVGATVAGVNLVRAKRQ